MLNRLLSRTAIRLLPIAVGLLVVVMAYGATTKSTEAASSGGLAGAPVATVDADYCGGYPLGYNWWDGYMGLPANVFTAYGGYYGYGCGYGYATSNCGGTAAILVARGCVQACPTYDWLYRYAPVCAGPPASITFDPSPSAVTCGSQSNITIHVRDSRGIPVVDGTAVTVSTTLGYDQALVETSGGDAVASLVIPTKTSGNAVITAVAGSGITGTKSITVTC